MSFVQHPSLPSTTGSLEANTQQRAAAPGRIITFRPLCVLRGSLKRGMVVVVMGSAFLAVVNHRKWGECLLYGSRAVRSQPLTSPRHLGAPFRRPASVPVVVLCPTLFHAFPVCNPSHSSPRSREPHGVPRFFRSRLGMAGFVNSLPSTTPSWAALSGAAKIPPGATICGRPAPRQALNCMCNTARAGI